jgi:hypothetical protein
LTALAIDTCLTQIEQALQTTILVGLGKRITVATNAAIQGLDSESMKHGKLAYSTAGGYVWRFNRYSTAAAASTVLVPTDAPTAGRWERTTSTSATGYLTAVELYEGEAGAQDILTRFKQQKPCVVINWLGNEWTPRSLVPGALFAYRPRFALWAVSGNLRGEGQAITGSQVTSEATRDPGANRIIGDLRELLAGSDLDQDGVQYVYLGRESRVVSSNAPNMHDRLMVYSIEIEVRASVHHPDTDLVTLDTSGGFRAQYNLMNTDLDLTFDDDNYVTSGMTVPIGAGLTKTIAAGTMYFDGESLSVASASKTFTASKWTWRDVNENGVYTYTETEIGAEAPTLDDDLIRIGVTETDAAGVAFDRVLAAAEIPVWSVNQIG